MIKEGLDVSWWMDLESTFATDIQPMFDVRNGITIPKLVDMAQLSNVEISAMEDIDFDCICSNH